MTAAEAKQELRGYIQNLRYIEQKRQDIAALRARVESAVKPLSGMPRGQGDPKRFEADMAKLIDLEAEHRRMLEDAEAQRLSIERKINTLEQPYRNVLYLRYIKNWSLIKIAYKMNYNYTWACELHGRALQKYARAEDSRTFL